MHVTIGYLLSKPRDFKICLNCGCFNWYENETCHTCGSKRFRKATQRDVDSYAKFRDENDEHFCMECEIDV
jgi:ribosomal protein L40E